MFGVSLNSTLIEIVNVEYDVIVFIYFSRFLSSLGTDPKRSEEPRILQWVT